MPEVMAGGWSDPEMRSRDTGSQLFLQGENGCPWSFAGGKNGANMPGLFCEEGGTELTWRQHWERS